MERKSPRIVGCDGFQKAVHISRRNILQVGALSALGLGSGAPFFKLTTARGQEVRGPVPRARACIFLFMWGGPSQLDTWDPKPDAPDEVRGEFRTISTSVPGTFISEHLVRMSKLVDKLTIVRSLSHSDPAHLSSGHATLTGQLAPVINSDADPPSPKDSPHVGSLLAKFRTPDSGFPGHVAMPWKALHPAAPGGVAPGQHAGWLGQTYEGMLLTGDLNHPDWKPEGLALPQGFSAHGLLMRKQLLRQLDRPMQTSLKQPTLQSFHDLQERAAEMLGSDKVRLAFDLSKETDATRERYGRNIHGQCVLMARRLVEHGVPLVSVNWHNDGKNFWDTHGNNFKRLKNDLIPPADMALSALLEDLEERGMLDETLVAWVGEFGRRPQITAGNAGREHWPFCYSGVLAGGGIKRGLVYGSSDKQAAYPATDPVTPQDFATTMLHALGVPTDAVLFDRENRPHRICSGRVIEDLLT